MPSFLTGLFFARACRIAIRTSGMRPSRAIFARLREAVPGAGARTADVFPRN